MDHLRPLFTALYRMPSTSEITGESATVSARVSAETMVGKGSSWRNGRRGRGWLRECTKPFLSRGNRGMLCALRHRRAALCAVQAMRIEWPGPYEPRCTPSHCSRCFYFLRLAPTSSMLLLFQIHSGEKFARASGARVEQPRQKAVSLKE